MPLNITAKQLEDKVEIPFHYVTEREEALEGFSWLQKQSALGFDTEATAPDKAQAKDPYRSEPLAVQLGTQERVYVFWLRRLLNSMTRDEFCYGLRSTLGNPDILKYAHSAKFDTKLTYVHFKVPTVRVYCTMLAEQVLVAGLGLRVSLQAVARRRAGLILLKGVRDEFINFQGQDMPEHMQYYAAKDVFVLPPIVEAQIAALYDRSLIPTAQLEMDVVNATAEMELHGVLLHRGKMQVSIDHYNRKVQEADERVQALYREAMKARELDRYFLFGNIKDLKVGSPQEKLEALTKLGMVRDEDRDRDGKVSVDKDFLKSRKGDDGKIDPLCQALIDWSNAMKIKSTYGEALLKQISPVTGRLHPQFNQLGLGDFRDDDSDEGTVATGRYTSSDPNLQNIPRASKEAQLFQIVDDAELALAAALRQQMGVQV